MSELPSTWEESTVGEIADVKLGKMLDSARNSGTPTPYLRNVSVRWGSFQLDDLLSVPLSDDEREAYQVSDGDLMVCEGGEPGRCAVWRNGPTEIKYQKALHRVRLSEGLSPEYLASYLRLIAQEGTLSSYFTGTTIKHLPRAAFMRVPVPVPPSPEQRRIVAKLDRLSARSAAARDHLAHTTKLATRAKQAILMECLSGDWPSMPLSEIAKVGTGATPKRGTPRFYDGGTIPWVTSGAVNSFKVVSADQFITPVAIDETNCKVFPAGTLLMAMYGEGKTRGMVARLEINAATNQAIAAIQIDPEAPVRDDWVIWLLHSQYLQLRELASGGVQPNLNLGMVKAIQVPAPPLVEQDTRLRKIEAAFARIDRLTEEATRAAHLLDRLDERLLARAFRGELVPQNPEDEPAEALLARIRQSRAATPKPKRGRQKKVASE